MKQLLIYLMTFCIKAMVMPLHAQETEVRFTDFLERMPKPAATLEESWQAYPDMVSIERVYRYASKELMSNLRVVYTPIYEQFKKNIESGKATASSFSAEERKLMEQYKQGSKSFSEENEFLYFQGLVEHRPLIGSGKLSWASSKAEPKLYLELAAMEKQFDWQGFKERSLGLYGFGNDHKELEIINDKLDSDLKNLPKKKVKLFENVYDDVADPDKAIALYKQYGQRVQKIFQARHTALYKWWDVQYATLIGIASKLDAISSRLGSGAAKLMVADLQARTWDALGRLNYVAQHLGSEALLSAISVKQVETAIELYQKYKETME